jgi:hypothetical protein
MARTRKQQPIGRLVTTRGRYRNAAGAELIESDDLARRNMVVTRRMSTIREQARKRRLREENPERAEKRARMAEPIDVEQAFFKCPLCAGTLGKGMKEFMNHLVEVHYANPQRYVQRCLERTAVFKKSVSEDPEMTEKDIVIETITCDEFDEIKGTMLDDKNNVMQCAKARYNLMIEKKREERVKIGTEISTLFVTGGDDGVRNGRMQTLEQEDEQRSLLAWAARFVNDAGSKQWWLGRLPKKGLIDYEGDKENLLSLAGELVATSIEPRGEETTVDEMSFWMKCKLCVYRGDVGDLYRGSTLFAQHITIHHKISMSFYVTKFIRTQEFFREHDCGNANCKHTGLIKAVNAEEEHV